MTGRSKRLCGLAETVIARAADRSGGGGPDANPDGVRPTLSAGKSCLGALGAWGDVRNTAIRRVRLIVHLSGSRNTTNYNKQIC
jgi:hypothetical protein